MEVDSCHTSENDQADGAVRSVIRPGSIVMLNMTEEDYTQHYWPKIQKAVDQSLSPNRSASIYYEEVYSCVYKCVCKQFAERLYNDLMVHICSYLERLSCNLSHIENSVNYINSFHSAMNHYTKCLDGIVPIFNYMSRFYIESKLRVNLKQELLRAFTHEVGQKHILRLLAVIPDLQAKPFSIAPSTMASLVKNLYTLQPEFASLAPEVFAKFIPRIMPPTSLADLPTLVQETQQMQHDLEHRQGFTRYDRHLKRQGDDDVLRGSHPTTDNNHNSS
ncbi:PREDICTED: CDK2-associated and cullin domain-containing protein 1-like isoform X2 [Priapulus caudatus]|uniref:CDK2-associated and cullin domain-containing protein 1-like isoform X2 n=1 Tax=Priapulus caudatus TaxID=37621 RepID=A0ABM1E2T4_PRICU|nr:PREDICTED: CDK2-associated and cullin domain-containing protein 1-like isoform X2 [Priapulus caudatus]